MKIAICTPCHGDPKREFVQALSPLLLHSSAHERKHFMQGKTPVSVNREQTAQAALEWGADALLWIDSDQTFPEDGLERLLAHDTAIVGCNIAMRGPYGGMTAGNVVDRQLEKVWVTPEKVHSGKLEPVDRLGLGFTLIRREVFEKVPRRWFVEAQSPDGEYVGEDVFFFERAQRAGFQPYVDNALSWQVGHCDGRVIFPVDALKHRDAATTPSPTK